MANFEWPYLYIYCVSGETKTTSLTFFFIKNSFAENSIKKYLKDSELKLFEQALKEGDRAKWARSLKNLSKISHPTAKKIIKWLSAIS